MLESDERYFPFRSSVKWRHNFSSSVNWSCSCRAFTHTTQFCSVFCPICLISILSSTSLGLSLILGTLFWVNTSSKTLGICTVLLDDKLSYELFFFFGFSSLFYLLAYDNVACLCVLRVHNACFTHQKRQLSSIWLFMPVSWCFVALGSYANWRISNAWANSQKRHLAPKALYQMANVSKIKLFKNLDQISLLPSVITLLLYLKTVASQTASKIEATVLSKYDNLKRPAPIPPVNWLSNSSVTISRISKKQKIHHANDWMKRPSDFFILFLALRGCGVKIQS